MKEEEDRKTTTPKEKTLKNNTKPIMKKKLFGVTARERRKNHARGTSRVL